MEEGSVGVGERWRCGGGGMRRRRRKPNNLKTYSQVAGNLNLQTILHTRAEGKPKCWWRQFCTNTLDYSVWPRTTDQGSTSQGALVGQSGGHQEELVEECGLRDEELEGRS